MKKIVSLLLALLLVLSAFCALAENADLPGNVSVKVIKEAIPNATIIAAPGDYIEVSTAGEGATTFYYCWDDETVRQVESSQPFFRFAIPADFELNTAHYFYASVGNMEDMAECFYHVIVSDKTTSFVTLETTFNGNKINPKDIIEVTGGEQIEVTAQTSLADSSIAFIGYYFVENGEKLGETNKVEGGLAAITVPDAAPGTERLLFVEAVDACDDGTENQITKTGWQGYLLKYGK